VVLTGSNADGTNGMKQIKKYGGLTIVQDPATAESGYMPASVIAAIKVDHILSLDGIVNFLIRISDLNFKK
jgi:two-component system chemotaxis response regulator CheB